jgi:hypothetical protein
MRTVLWSLTAFSLAMIAIAHSFAPRYERYNVIAGDTVVFDRDVAVSESFLLYHRVARAYDEGDLPTLHENSIGGTAFVARKGDHAILIEAWRLSLCVRLVDGENAGRVGWIARGLVHR